ncbi:MAG: DUF4339 domain-containing protein [Bacteroidia bacterium]
MRRYFVYQNGQQSGPFSIKELQNKRIERETSIWFEGLDD